MYWLRYNDIKYTCVNKYIVLSTLSHQLTDMHLHEIDTQSRHLSTELMDSIVIVFIIVQFTDRRKYKLSASWFVSQYYMGHH